MAFDWFGLRKSKPASGPAPNLVFSSREGDLPVTALRSSDAWPEWQRLRARSGQSGRWPLLLGKGFPEEDRMEPEGTASEVLAEADRIDLASWLKERSDDGNQPQEDFDPAELTAKGEAKPSFTVISGVSASKGNQTYLVQVPCAEGWMVPAVVPFGDWNDCPADPYHAALFRRWQQAHGAELVGLSLDVAEFFLPKPIADPRLARTLAWDMYAYAPDTVDQGVGTVRDLAESLLGSSTWFFWWD